MRSNSFFNTVVQKCTQHIWGGADSRLSNTGNLSQVLLMYMMQYHTHMYMYMMYMMGTTRLLVYKLPESSDPTSLIEKRLSDLTYYTKIKLRAQACHSFPRQG